jgi:hypothetical protein
VYNVTQIEYGVHMENFHKHGILGVTESDLPPPGATELLAKRLDEEGFRFLDLGNGYVDVLVDLNEREVPALQRILQRIYDKTGVMWNVPYEAESHDEIGTDQDLKWSMHPWGIRIEADDEMREFAATLDGAQVRVYPKSDGYSVVDLPRRHLPTVRAQAGVEIDADVDWESLIDTASEDPMTWPSSAFAMIDEPPETEDDALRVLASHQMFVELLSNAGLPYIEIAPGYLEFKLKSEEKKEQMVIRGILAQVERASLVAWRNPKDPIWLDFSGRDHTFSITLHETFIRVETEEAWDYAKTLPGAEPHSWPNGKMRGVDFWGDDEELVQVGKDVMTALTEWSGPKQD